MRSLVTRTLALAILLAPAALLAQATVSGTITTEDGTPIPGASIFLGDLEATSGRDGTYSLSSVPPGLSFMVVFKEGYRTGTREITVPAVGTLTEDFKLQVDLLYSDTLVVTGTRSPQKKRESSVSITTLNAEQIEDREARSTADLLRVIPGFYVESSGGEVGGNLWVRGLPADGSYRYVALMEDGMPVYDSTELFFVNADIFVRFDENVAELEAVRGGNAALFGSNAPGGVINLISKTGSDPGTDLKFTVGTDGLWRVGFNNRGPLSEDWTYSIGGFYRFDEGERDPGYPASNGGQLKLNLTRTTEDGYIRFYAKRLDDSNVFYLPLPFLAGPGLNFVPGFPEDGTLHTPEANHLRAPRPNGEGFVELPLEDGQRQEGTTLMAEYSKQLENGWLLENTARYLSIDHSWNAVVPFDVVTAADFAAGFTPPGGRNELTYVNHPGPVAQNNGFLLVAGLWHVEKPMENFSNQFQLSKQFTAGSTSHTFTIGAYTSSYSAGNLWFFNDILTDVRTQPRLVDLTVFDAAGRATRVTDNGFRGYGSFHVNANGDVDLFALYASDTIQVNDKLRLDVGVRHEQDDFRQFTENLSTFDLGDPTTLADNNVSGGNGTITRRTRDFSETALSLGFNYLLNDNVAIWGRGGTGFKMPILDTFLFGDAPVAESINQFEFGTRIGTPRLGLNVTAYWLTLEDFPSSDARIDPVTGETIFVIDFVGEAETTGIETELVAEPAEGFRISLSATFQQPEYKKFAQGANNLSGNQVRRIAEEIIDLTLSYHWDRASVSANWNYYGDRFADDANTVVLPSFDVTNLRATYEVSETTTIAAGLANAFDDIGLTEGNPRLEARTGATFLARPILGRRATLSIEFAF